MNRSCAGKRRSYFHSVAQTNVVITDKNDHVISDLRARKHSFISLVVDAEDTPDTSSCREISWKGPYGLV